MQKPYSSQENKILLWFISQKFTLRGFLATGFYAMSFLQNTEIYSVIFLTWIMDSDSCVSSTSNIIILISS